MDKFIKLALIVCALLAGGGVFYHYVVFLPGLERAKQDQLAEEKRNAAESAIRRQATYEICKTLARKNYDANWAQACETVAIQRQRNFQNCMVDPTIMTNQFLGEGYCKRAYPSADPAPDCALPGARSDSINSLYKEEQDKCLAEARTGL